MLHPNPYASPAPDAPVEAEFADEVPGVVAVHRLALGLLLTIGGTMAAEGCLRNDCERIALAGIAVAGVCASAKASEKGGVWA